MQIQNGLIRNRFYEYSWNGSILASQYGRTPSSIVAYGTYAGTYTRSVLKNSYMYDGQIDGQYVQNAIEYRYEICRS